MTRSPRGAALVAVALTVPVVVALLLLDASGSARFPITVPVAVAVTGLVVLAIRRGVESVGLVLLGAAVATASWNATSIKGLPPAHLCLAAALLVLVPVAAAKRRRVVVPVWVWVLGSGIVLVAGISILAQVGAAYLATRFQVPLEAVEVARIPAADVADRLNAVRWLVPAVALPLAVCLAVAPRPHLAVRFADVWVLGVAVNAAAAVTDQLRLTHLSAALLPFVDIGGRQAGLTAQPNHLALSAALVLPVAVWRLMEAGSRHPGATRAAAGLAVAALLGGVLVSGSRGGIGIAAGAGLCGLLVSRNGRRLAPWLAGLAAAGVTVAAALHPELLGQVGTRLRLSGAASAEESDAIRSRIHAQALEDFAHDPVRGIGLHVLSDGHDIWLQLIASGGVLLLTAFVVTMLGVLLDGRAALRAGDRVVAPLLVSIVAWLAVGVVENQIADLYLYIPIALVAGLRAAAVLRSSPATDPVPALSAHPAAPALMSPIRGTP